MTNLISKKSSRNFLMLAATVIAFAACTKSDSNACVNTGVVTTAEITQIQTYLSSKGITATQDSRGFFYHIVGPGYGSNFPTIASSVTAKYKGSLSNGTIFDSTVTGATATFPLSNVILGWQYGVPLIKKGGVINLYLPASLGYGCNANGSIPANSMLIFNVEVVNY